MESYLYYIGKVALAAGTFYLLYLALFQHQKHFVFNRIYLPVSLAVSFIIPLITFTTVKYIAPLPTLTSNSFAYLPEVAEIIEPAFVYQWYHYLTAIYALGIFAFFVHLFIGHLRAISIIRFSQLKELFGAQVNVSEKDVHPFSFFNKIVLSEKTLDNPSLEVIVKHEQIHVNEKHTLDILFAEILFLFQWFNPFAWLIKDAMRNNLEYLTDDQITKNNNAEAYQLAMVGLAHKEGVAPFLNALNGSQLKNRIIMMKKKTENKYALLKQLIVLPLLAILVMGLSNKEVKMEFVQAEKEVKIVVDGIAIPENHAAFESFDFSKNFDGGEITKALGLDDKVVSNTLSVSDNKRDLTYYVQTTDYVAGSYPDFEQMTSPIQKNEEIANPKKSLYAIDGKILADEEIENINNKNFESATVLSGKQATDKYGEIAENATIMDLTSGDPKVKIGSKTSATEILISGKVSNTEGEAIAAATIVLENTSTGTITDMQGNYEIKVSGENPVLLVRMLGYEFKKVPATKDNINVVLSPVNIDSNKISPYGFVVKDKSEVKGKVTNEKGIPIAGVTILIKETKIGTITDKQGNYELQSDAQIEAIIVVMKGFVKKEVQVDGEPLVNIVLKADSNAKVDDVKVIGYGKQKEDVIVVGYGEQKDKPERIRLTADGENQPLIVVDGIPVKDIDNIKPEDIESVSVLKDESSTALYGEKGKNGVVLINTKKSGIKGHNHKLESTSDVKVVGFGKQKGDVIVVGYGEQKDKPERIRLRADSENPPLYVLDGKEVASIENMKPDEIESISILKDESATSVYGEKGKNGVILITTKEAAKNKVDATDKLIIVDGKKYDGDINDIDPKDISSIEVRKNQPDNNIYDGKGPEKDKIIIQTKTKYNSKENNPLVFVDGLIHTGSMDDINPEDIANISVLKDASALSYDPTAKNGVILVTTKSAVVNITSELELRKFIAKKIKYPLRPQKDQVEGTVKVFVKVLNDGTINYVSAEKVKDAIRAKEVVVVAYKPEEKPTTDKLDNYDKYFRTELKQVLYQLTRIDIEEYKGKTIAITAKFILQ